MKANRSSVFRAVDEPDPRIRFYLFLGQDESQSRALAARLLEALGASKFMLAPAELKTNPALLVDEAAALSLFGERRLVWIEPATADITEAVEALLAAPSVESPVVGIAGALSKSSSLVKLVEGSPQALAFTAYAPDGEDAVRMVIDLARRVGLKMSSRVAARIADASGNDQAIVAQELEKLALYAAASPHSPRALEEEDLDAVGADNDEHDIRQLGDLALLGNIAELAVAVERLRSTSEAVPAIRAMQRRLLQVAPARARVERGERTGAVMASLGKSLFWKDKPLVEKILARWSAHELATISTRLGMLERKLMFSEIPEREALGEELLAIARKARSAPGP